MKRIIIGKNLEGEAAFKRSAEEKIKLYKDATAYTDQFITITNQQEFERSFTDYLIEELRPMLKGKKNNILEPSQIAEMNGVNISVLRYIERRYKSNKTPLNTDFLSYTVPDFNQYTENEAQVKAFELSSQLIKAINEFQKEYPINLNYIRKATPLMAFNATSELIPSPIYINGL